MIQDGCQTLADPGDCSHWLTTDAWTIPVDQTTGVYLAKVAPTSGLGSQGSHILFVIRDDESGSDILFQTSDTTWQAYNAYNATSGTSFYNGAVRVSYDRPLRVGAGDRQRTFFGAEYQMIRFLERNGFDVSYSTGVDTARRGGEIAEHRVFLSVGHDEYWSREMRDAATAARDLGTHLVFLSGNLMYWKTRWEDDFRTQVSYKTSQHGSPADPDGFTGTWRDVRFERPGDPAEPENSLTGLIFGSNDLGAAGRPIRVPEADGRRRLWRDTPAAQAASCDVVELAPHTVGFEFDTDQDNGARPDGLVRLSTSHVSRAPVLVGAGTHAAGGAFFDEISDTHHASLYRHASGALVFNGGTIQWSLGLGATHLAGFYAGKLDLTLAQATANLLQDMGALGATAADACLSTLPVDSAPPDSLITSHVWGATERMGSTIRITGTAWDADGEVGGVEVSFDNGNRWHPASGRESWHYDWQPTATTTQYVRSRAVDDSGRLETSTDLVQIDLDCGGGRCSVWPPDALPVIAQNPDAPVEVGVRFRSDSYGSLHGIRFWAHASNPGPHLVHLWSEDGTLLESTTSPASATTGWRTASFSVPFWILPNQTYVASYHTSTGYALTRHGLEDAWYRKPLRALGGGGVYAYGASPTFPTSVFQDTNYWVDLDFEPALNSRRSLFHDDPVPTDPDYFDATASADPWGVELGIEFRSEVDGLVRAIRFYRADDGDAQIVNLWRSLPATHTFAPVGDLSGGDKGMILASGRIPAGSGIGWQTVPLADAVPILAGATYVASYHTQERYAVDRFYFGTPVSDPPLIGVRGRYRYGKTAYPEQSFEDSNYWIDVELETSASLRHSLWREDVVPAVPHQGDSEVEVGARFAPEVDGFVEGIRFYKHPANGGSHVGTLWSSTGVELATSTFAGESSCGWQTQLFAAPVPVQAGQVYVASYHSSTGYAADRSAGAVQQFPVWSVPLRALGNGEGGVGNGVYAYGPRSFPTSSFSGTNYFVDVVFRTAAVPAEDGPTLVPHHPLP
jgi:hypothetical protein